MNARQTVVPLALAIGIAGWLQVPYASAAARKTAAPAAKSVGRVVKTDQEWKKALTPEQYRVLRQKGTERAFTGKLWNSHEPGIYRCAGCGLELFDAGTKFDSGTGWPSFWAPVAKANVGEHNDVTLGMRRTEVVCNRCGGHLGHMFDDGPVPTGLRYCINSAALEFAAKKK